MIKKSQSWMCSDSCVISLLFTTGLFCFFFFFFSCFSFIDRNLSSYTSYSFNGEILKCCIMIHSVTWKLTKAALLLHLLALSLPGAALSSILLIRVSQCLVELVYLKRAGGRLLGSKSCMFQYNRHQCCLTWKTFDLLH